MTEYRTAADMAADTISHLEQKFGDPVREATARLDEVEQKMARFGKGGGFETTEASWGQQVANAPELKDFAEFRTRPSRVSLEVKDITSATGSGASLAPPVRDLALLQPKRRLTIRDLLPVVSVSSGSVEYPRQSSYTNAAAMVAEGDLKPESDMTFDLVSVAIRTVAHWVTASRQILDDAPQLQGLIDGELRYGLTYAEEVQLLNGNGVGQNLTGIIANATPFAAGSLVIASPNRIDVVLAAMHQQDLADLPADGVVMHPADFTAIRSTKNADGEYIMGPPGANLPPTLFGLPVVATPAIAAGTFLVGNFQGSASLYDRWQPRVEISTEHSDFFVRNLVAVLAESRIGLAVKRPTGFTTGTFTAAITDLTS